MALEMDVMFQRKQLRCSFCRRKEAEVSKLVAGPRVYICDGCVALASRLMEGSGEDQTQPPKAEPSLWRRILRVHNSLAVADVEAALLSGSIRS